MTFLLKVEDLKMYYKIREGWVKAVDGISFSLDKGCSFGIVGESGCGKSSVALAIMRLLPRNAKVIGGRIFFNGTDLMKIPLDELRSFRLKKMAMIFQSAMNALNPVFRVGDQLADAFQYHEKVSREEAKARVQEIFELVNLDSSVMQKYPHELSGGMRQRVMIAMSLLCNPDLIIADEPTTALDVVVQDQILQSIKDLQERLKLSLILISHDISVILETCDKIAVMYGGQIVEYGDSNSIFNDPHHPYTSGLFESFPTIHAELKDLMSIPGSPPDLINPLKGCRFAPRCIFKKNICEKDPPFVKVKNEHYSKCHFANLERFEWRGTL